MGLPEGAERLVVGDLGDWRAWLVENEYSSNGVWLALAKKGVVTPTSLTYQQALDAALCSGWIDGQKRSFDEHTFVQRFTPRRPRSLWSARNVEIVEGFVASGAMRPRGQAEIDKAKADGRWERAYAGSATAVVPPDLEAALAASPRLRQRFDALSRAERFALLHPLMTAATDATRTRRLEKALASLED